MGKFDHIFDVNVHESSMLQMQMHYEHTHTHTQHRTLNATGKVSNTFKIRL